ncbi:Hypothetical protein Minf_0077 [Methylacidiphilum infernorum V4]|uniref:Uncharacterized protein n=1 Tax=Methylacidiphilum infernorum (isolate V4) TaxID=481448 RepID=B3DWZ7_METI4|nr:Hypothetical protein Minf_0077 [Methylacidiphilum infernorum V4]
MTKVRGAVDIIDSCGDEKGIRHKEEDKRYGLVLLIHFFIKFFE